MQVAQIAPVRVVRRLERRRPYLIVVAALAVAAAGAGYWLYARQFETTDNAQVDAHIGHVSPRVFGTIQAVHVVEHQRVVAGQLLAEIDPADLRVAVAEARALVARAEAELQETDPTIFITDTSNRAAIASSTSDLASTRATAAEARNAVEQLTAQLAQAEAANRTAQAERRRVESLAGGGAVPQAEVEALVNAAEASRANTLALGHALKAARDRVSAHGARVAMAASKVVELQENAPHQMAVRRAALLARQAALDLAKARLARAELELGYGQIRAPSAGIVGKRAVNVGDRVAPGQLIIAIAHVQDLWVTANFRETQLRRLASGQQAELYVDALAVWLPGTVESFGGATGARFSLLPPENATGNYVKVVQRIPVRIRFQGSASTLERLRPGMSVEARVQIR